ncbi:hypothetical protein [Streptomyces tagetis]|uniref:Uncharacterized protein n=1 Tax=Streptomyces tagetis TaxID=2820809 RepID=A0A941B123_9ACTN|nr:hypothetical protein [Streptomyces sp. RG38]MBQ0825627.1 hypothetical protein [Streptomyces sp. RG38]
MRRTAGPARGTARALVTTLFAGAALGVFAGTAPADTGLPAHPADAAVPGPAATDPLPCDPVPEIPDADPPVPGEDPAAWHTLPGADAPAPDPAYAGTTRALAVTGAPSGPAATDTTAPDPETTAPDPDPDTAAPGTRARDAYGLPADDGDDDLLGAPGPDRAADGGCPPVPGDDALWGAEPGEDAPWAATSALPQGTTRPTCPTHPTHPTPGDPCGTPEPPCPTSPHDESHDTPTPHGRPGGATPRGSCATTSPEHGVRAGQGGAFTGSVPALAAGGVLIAGALGGAAHRLRPRTRRGGGER